MNYKSVLVCGKVLPPDIKWRHFLKTGNKAVSPLVKDNITNHHYQEVVERVEDILEVKKR